VLYISHDYYLLSCDLISSLWSLSIFGTKKFENQYQLLQINYSWQTYMSYIQQFAEIYPKIYSLIVRYINGAHNQEKALTSLSTGSRLSTSVLDYWFYTARFIDVSSISFSISTSRPSSIMYNIGDIHTDNRSRGLSLRINLSCL